MFEHSVKVPRHFKIAANIVRKVSEEGGSVKSLLYDGKLKHFRTSVLYALINETIKHSTKIEKIFEKCGILVNEPRLDLWLAKILTAELLYGKKKLPGKSKPEQTILTYREKIEKLATEVQDDDKSKVVPRPRYVRINTNLLTTSDAIRAFQDEGYKFIRCTSGSYNDYLQQIQNLTENDFTQDYHVKTIFVFSPGTKMHEHDLYWEHKIILQDKATALAVHLLAPPPGSVVLDMCAAPGMKATQLAAYLRNQGKIYAVERNEKRYETLCEYVEATGSKCVETLHKDSLEIKRGDLDDVEYILLDPSCSGSGMELSVHNYIDETRLAKLTNLQEKFLKHAMNSFPNAKRIVYSTCSMFPEENERVVTNIVKASRAKWRVKDIKELLKEQWNNFGSGMYGSIGTRCLYAKPDTDFTIGFFVAVLDRDFREKEKSESDNKLDSEVQVKKESHEVKKQPSDKVRKEKSKNDEVNCNATSSEIILKHDNENNICKNSKKRKHKLTVEVESHEFGESNEKKNRKKSEQCQTLEDNEHFNNETEKEKTKKKKHKVSDKGIDEHEISESIINQTEVVAFDNESKKQRKKKKNCDHEVRDRDIFQNSKLIENQLENPQPAQSMLKERYKIQKLMVDENDHTEKEDLKIKKKKQKVKELQECVMDTPEKQGKRDKSKKKNKQDDSYLLHSEQMQLSFSAAETINSDKRTRKEKKSVNKDNEISEVDQVFEKCSRKKKKKKRVKL